MKAFRIKKLLILFVLSLLLFLKADGDFGHVESGIYFDYTQSIVEDGDFNIVNQFFDHEEKKYVTKNHYYPDFHSHGSVIYWSYLYSFAHIINKSFLHLGGEARDLFLNISLSFSSVFFFLFGMLLLPKTLALFNRRFPRYWYFLLPLVTPLYFYTVIEPGNGSIVAFPLVQVLIHIYSWCLKEFSYKNMMLYGGFLALAFISKVDAVFYGVLPFHAYFYFYKEKQIIEVTKKILSFLGVFALINSLQLINDYIKYGLFSYGYIDTVFSDYNLFWEVLFSPYHGIIYYSPLYLLSVIGFIFLLYRFIGENISSFKSTDFLLIFLTLVGLIKLYIFSGSYSHGSGVFGGRQFMTEIPTLLMLAMIILEKIKKTFKAVLLVFVTLWSLMVFFSYNEMSLNSSNFTPWDVDANHYLQKIAQGGGKFLVFLKDLFIGFNEVETKLSYFWIYPLVFALIFSFLRFGKLKRYACIFFIFFSSTYALQTSYNYFYGKKNVAKMKEEGFFQNALVGNDVAMYFYYENMGSLNERLVFLKANGNEKEYERVNKIRTQYHEKAKSQITVYPDRSIPMFKYYKELGTEHHMIEGMKEEGIPLLE